MLFLARVMLKKPKIIALDEATSNMDFESFTLFNEKLNTHFKTCTILNISTNVQSVITYDRILMMENGL